MRSSFGVGALPISILFLISSTTAQQFYGGLKIEVTGKVECTRHTKVGDVLSMNYRGTLESDGREFDSSYGILKEPFKFKLGAHQVIKGWDQGLVGMCIGEHRKLTIPPALAYGNRGVGIIPGGATLIFETELMGIEGVEKEKPIKNPDDPEHRPDGEKGEPDKGSDKGPKDGENNNGECKLLGPFALLVQGALGILALSVLVWKRYRETPRRPLKVWAFDASKQVTGSAMLHLLNLLMSMFSSGDFDITKQAQQSAAFVQDDRNDLPNPCSFYLLNLAIDTTVGIPILVGLLRLFHILFSYTPLARPEGSLRSGSYGHPPKYAWWGKQVMIYFLGLIGMKACVFALFQLFPWIGWVGDWALRWTEGKEWVQITFVMLIFPLIMNGLQYYIIDSFIKDSSGANEEEPKDGEDEEEEGLIGGRSQSEDDSEDSAEQQARTGSARIKEANPTPMPAEYDPDEERLPGSSSSVGSQRKNQKLN